MFRRYRVERELGRGGMGIVVLAHDTALDIPVAVKLVPDLVVKDDEAFADLRKEVLRGMALTHPGIVRTHNFERDETGAGIVMEYVDGDTLSAVKLRQPAGCFLPDDILPWIEQLCIALEYAHREARIVHRDLKPRNVMLTRAGKVKVADFGIAATLNDSVSRHSMEGMISGTLSYMSPQQAQGHRPTHLDDIHALGATIYELLTGKPPFFRGSPTAIHAQILTATAPSMAQRREELEVRLSDSIPATWERTVAACLSKEPSERPQSAIEILDGLSGAGPVALRNSKPSRTWMAAAAGAAGAAVVGTIFLFATREAKEARPSASVSIEASPAPTEGNATPEPVPPPPAPSVPPPVIAAATPLPTPVAPSPTPMAPETPRPIASLATPTQMPVQQASLPKANRKTKPRAVQAPTPPTAFNGNYVILPSSTPRVAWPSPPPGIPVYRPELTDREFYQQYPNNPRAYGPGPWEEQQAAMRGNPTALMPMAPTAPIGASAVTVPAPDPAPIDSAASTSERLDYYVRELDGWLTPLHIEPRMRPQSEIHQLRERVKLESAKAANGDAQSAANVTLSEALAGAIDARENVLIRALKTQTAPSTRLGGGNNSAFFMGVIRSDWEKARATWRTRIIHSAAKVDEARRAQPSAPPSR